MNLLRKGLDLDKIPLSVALKKMPFRVSIEGNIGCGKSTLIKYFAKNPEVDAHMEPIDLWCNVNGHNLLHLLYEDLKKWNLTFQSYVQLTRLDIQMQKTKNKVQMFERSVQNNRYCFAEMARNNNLLSDPEYTVFCKWYDWIQKNMDIDLDLIVYLRSSPEVVYERIKQRKRAEERSIPLEYLKDVHETYEHWLFKSKNVAAPVLTLDVDQGLDSVLKQYEEHKDIMLGQARIS